MTILSFRRFLSSAIPVSLESNDDPLMPCRTGSHAEVPQS
jgi:hypothetical protein